MPDVREIVKEWLRAHGYDGLCYYDCGCEIEDLMPCTGYSADCQPGYRTPGACEGDWRIEPTKEKHDA